jgi:predicted site-specific integrase-resolvase
MQPGWLKIKTAAKYIDVSPRTLRHYLKCGLKYSRLPSGSILIRREDLDIYLMKFIVAEENPVGQIVDDVVNSLRGKHQ